MKKYLTIVLIALLTCGISAGTPVYAAEEPTAQQAQFIKAECEKYGLSYTLVFGVCMAESSWDTRADSGSSVGVMQLHRGTYPTLAKDLQIEDFDPYDFEDNVQAGVYKLACLRDIWQERGYMDEEVVPLMLISYNRGVRGCERYVEKYGLQNDYAQRVLAYKYVYEQQEAVMDNGNGD